MDTHIVKCITHVNKAEEQSFTDKNAFIENMVIAFESFISNIEAIKPDMGANHLTISDVSIEPCHSPMDFIRSPLYTKKPKRHHSRSPVYEEEHSEIILDNKAEVDGICKTTKKIKLAESSVLKLHSVLRETTGFHMEVELIQILKWETRELALQSFHTLETFVQYLSLLRSKLSQYQHLLKYYKKFGKLRIVVEEFAQLIHKYYQSFTNKLKEQKIHFDNKKSLQKYLKEVCDALSILTIISLMFGEDLLIDIYSNMNLELIELVQVSLFKIFKALNLSPGHYELFHEWGLCTEIVNMFHFLSQFSTAIDSRNKTVLVPYLAEICLFCMEASYHYILYRRGSSSQTKILLKIFFCYQLIKSSLIFLESTQQHLEKISALLNRIVPDSYAFNL